MQMTPLLDGYLQLYGHPAIYQPWSILKMKRMLCQISSTIRRGFCFIPLTEPAHKYSVWCALSCPILTLSGWGTLDSCKKCTIQFAKDTIFSDFVQFGDHAVMDGFCISDIAQKGQVQVHIRLREIPGPSHCMTEKHCGTYRVNALPQHRAPDLVLFQFVKPWNLLGFKSPRTMYPMRGPIISIWSSEQFLLKLSNMRIEWGALTLPKMQQKLLPREQEWYGFRLSRRFKWSNEGHMFLVQKCCSFTYQTLHSGFIVLISSSEESYTRYTTWDH